MRSIEEKQNIEIQFWRDSEHESPESDSVYNIINKFSDAAVFIDCINKYKNELPHEHKALELGGGQGWAACLYKRLFKNAHVTLTDISPFAVKSLHKWERLWQVKLDNAYDCTSYETKEQDSSIDVVFCFAAAHHFLHHNRTLREISRILKPGGKAFYFYEPATPKFLYSLSYWRVNRKRPEIPEDVLITNKILDLANKNGLDARVDFYPSLIKRGPFETLYYSFLNRLPVLQKLLPCSANFIFTKRIA